MASTATKSLPHEKRKDEAALSDFADYVEKQQALRYPSKHKEAAATAGPSTTASNDATADPNHHAELDDILDALDLSDSAPRVSLRRLLLGGGGGSSDENNEDETMQKLVSVVSERLDEGHGEALFEIGFENDGEPMHLVKEEWDVAYGRLQAAARKLNADCQLLLTKNVGGDVEASSPTGKDKDCSGKVLIRQVPATVEEVIETRIAVVGNGMSSCLQIARLIYCAGVNDVGYPGLTQHQSMPERAQCSASSSRVILMTAEERRE
jgi:hypothetical protein